MAGLITCPDCGIEIFEDDNKVWLDTPAVEWDGGRAQWTLMRLGKGIVATAGNADQFGQAHTLHDHQHVEGPMQ